MYHRSCPPLHPATNLSHQGLDVRAAVVSRHLGMKVFPYSLDLVVIGAIRRKEVQDEPSAKRPDGHLGDPTGMDAKVIQDDMDDLRLRIHGGQLLQECDEQPAVLSLGLDPDQRSESVV